jgi:hypothetical protein
MKTKMKKLLLIPVLMATCLFTYAQRTDLSGLYKNLGIKLLTAEKGSRTGTSYRLQADSIYFNGYATILNNVPVNFEKTASGPKISFGSRHILHKKSNTDYVLETDGMSKAVSISGKNELDATDDARFTLMVILLNYIDIYSIKNYAADAALARVKKCGAWTVIEMGLNSSTAMYHLSQGIASFASNNSHCSLVGVSQSDCFLGTNHICIASQSFHCPCGTTIPFIGIGWD